MNDNSNDIEYASLHRRRSVPLSVLRARLERWGAEIEADRRRAAAPEQRAPIAPPRDSRSSDSVSTSPSPWLAIISGAGEIVGSAP